MSSSKDPSTPSTLIGSSFNGISVSSNSSVDSESEATEASFDATSSEASTLATAILLTSSAIGSVCELCSLAGGAAAAPCSFVSADGSSGFFNELVESFLVVLLLPHMLEKNPFDAGLAAGTSLIGSSFVEFSVPSRKLPLTLAL